MAQGQVFQRTYKAPDGTVRTCRTWIIRWYRIGRPHEESTTCTRKGDALNLLKLRNGDVAKGKPITAGQFKLTVDDAAQTVLDDFTANGKRSLAVVERRLRKHVLPYFGGRRLADITPDYVLAYIAKRRADTELVRKAYDLVRKDWTVMHVPEHSRTIAGVSNAEINRELQVLKRCFSLALKHGKIFTRPDIPLLRESAPAPAFSIASRWKPCAGTSHCAAQPRPLRLHHWLADGRGSATPGMATGRLRRRDGITAAWHDEEPSGADLQVHGGSAGAAGGATGRN